MKPNIIVIASYYFYNWSIIEGFVGIIPFKCKCIDDKLTNKTYCYSINDILLENLTGVNLNIYNKLLYLGYFDKKESLQVI